MEVLSITHHAGDVASPIDVLVISDLDITLVGVVVDGGAKPRQLGNQVHGILETVIPVLLLVNTIGISLLEFGVSLKSSHTNGQLRHRVKVLGEVEHEVLNPGGNLGSGSPLSGQLLDLSVGGDLTSDKEPEKTLREGLFLDLGELLLQIEDGVSTKSDSFIGIQKRGLRDKAVDITSSTISLLNGDLTQNLRAMLVLNLLNPGLLFRDDLGQPFLQSKGRTITNRRGRERSSTNAVHQPWPQGAQSHAHHLLRGINGRRRIPREKERR
mmetsp:Transcript_26428/g.41134  ORF Transcript_26428/g.41134 Transcript_26428/m.41134 type:complete len:269 (+) Transcript_26428:731-1537(+)